MRWFSSPAEPRRARSRPIYCGNGTAGRTPVSKPWKPSGDALAPATIAHAVYAGRRYAEDLDGAAVPMDEVPFKREIAELIE